MSGKTKVPPTTTKKQEFIERHFAFEVRELNWCVGFYVATQIHKVGKNLDVERFMVNTALDHAFLHARNLIEFFYEGNDPENYAHAIAFSPRWGPPRKPKILRTFERRVNPEVAHLCWARLSRSQEDQMWNVDEVAVPILREVLRFIDSLDASYMTESLGVLKLETQAVINLIKVVQEPRSHKIPVRDLFAEMERGGHVP